MTFEEFDQQLPKHLSGGMIRSSFDGAWMLKIWRKSREVDGMQDFQFLLLAPNKTTTPEQLFELALPIARAYVEAVNKLRGL